MARLTLRVDFGDERAVGPGKIRLLELIDEGTPKPACIIGMPVGFVGAAESKAELIVNPRGIPFATIKGRKGGSAMASSVINALTSDNQ